MSHFLDITVPTTVENMIGFGIRDGLISGRQGRT